jgi:WD40 repeat protein
MVIPEEKLLFTSDYHGEMKAWDLDTSKVLRSWPLQYGAMSPMHLRDRGWILIPAAGGIQVIRVSDFAPIASWPLGKVEAPFYDPATKRFFFATPSDAGAQIRELDLDTGKATTGAIIPNPPFDRAVGAVPKLWAARILPLADGRLLIQFNLQHGLAILDPTNWTKIDRRTDDKRSFFVGRPGELFAVPVDNAQKIEVLDSRTLAVLRSVEIPADQRPSQGGLYSKGFTAETPDRPANAVFTGYQTVLLFDPTTLQITKRMKHNFNGLVPLAGDDWIATTEGGANIFRLPEGRFVRSFGFRTYLGTRLATAPSGFRVMLSTTYNGSSRRIDFADDGVNIVAYDEQPQHATYSPDGKLVAFFLGRERIPRVSAIGDFPRKDRAFNRTNKVPLPVGPNFIFSPDQKHLAVLSSMTTHVYELATGRLVFEAEAGASAAHPYSTSGHAAFSPDGTTFAYNIGVKEIPYGRVRAVDLATGAQKWEQRGYFTILRYSPDGRALETLDLENKFLTLLDPATGGVRTRTIVPVPGASNTQISHWKLSADGTRLLAYGFEKFVVCEYPSLRALSVHNVPGYALASADFFARSDFFVTLNSDNKLRLWKAGQPEPLGTLILFDNGRDWCFHTPGFQFQASPAGMREVYFVKGRSIVPLESLFEQFFTPRLPAQLFAGEKLQPAVEVAKIKVPPKVTLALETGTRGLVVEDDIPVVKSAEPQVKIAVEATSPQEAIAEVRLYHNGKLVQAATRGLVVEDDPGARSEKRTFPLVLLPGENVFRAVAINAQRIESVPAELIVKFAPPAAKADPAVAAGPAAGGGGLQLHLVVVGVNKYRNPRFNLNSAVPDATAVRDRV